MLSDPHGGRFKGDQRKHICWVANQKGVEVIIARPGDTVIFRTSDAHAVITVYPELTLVKEQLAIINVKYCYKFNN